MLQCPACGSGVQVPYAQQPAAPQFAPDPFGTLGLGGAAGLNQPQGFAGQGYPAQGFPGQNYPVPGMGGGLPAAAPAANSQKGLWIGLGVGGGVLAIGVLAFVMINASAKRPTPVAVVPPALPMATTPLPTPVQPAVPPSATTPPLTPTQSIPAAGPTNPYAPATNPMPMPTAPVTTPSPMSPTTPMSGSSSPSSTSFSPSPMTPSPPVLKTPGSGSSGPDNGQPFGNQGSFESAVSQYHQAARAPFAGLRRVGSSEIEQMHFSWMVELLPYLNKGDVYNKFRFERPLTEGVNITVATKVIPEFLMPGDDRQRWQGYPFPGLGLTHFAGMSGIEDSRNVVAAKLPRSDPRAGVFGYKEIAKAADITDGTSQTIMIVGSGQLANPWAMGGGATIRGAREPYFDKLSGLGTKGPKGGSMVVMADGSVRHISGDVDPQVFRAMCTIHGKDSVDLEKSTTPGSLR